MIYYAVTVTCRLAMQIICYLDDTCADGGLIKYPEVVAKNDG